MSMINLFLGLMLILMACLSYLLVRSEARAEAYAARQWTKLVQTISCSAEAAGKNNLAGRPMPRQTSAFQTTRPQCSQQNSGMVRQPAKTAFFEIGDGRDAANAPSVIEYTLPRLLCSDREMADREQGQKDSAACPFCA
ncbi:MAG: hypothetical protein VB070_12000 [Clostridiaceae bacterium]|nr:hypothetical protein [Clostridiaceae bacterium]